MSSKRITMYISGPMTGIPDLNFPAFFEAEKQLRDAGFDVINPAAIDQPDKSWEACMRKDIAELMRADFIVTLPDWHKSRGAKLEVFLAGELGMGITDLDSAIRLFGKVIQPDART